MSVAVRLNDLGNIAYNADIGHRIYGGLDPATSFANPSSLVAQRASLDYTSGYGNLLHGLPPRDRRFNGAYGSGLQYTAGTKFDDQNAQIANRTFSSSLNLPPQVRANDFRRYRGSDLNFAIGTPYGPVQDRFASYADLPFGGYGYNFSGPSYESPAYNRNIVIDNTLPELESYYIDPRYNRNIPGGQGGVYRRCINNMYGGLNNPYAPGSARVNGEFIKGPAYQPGCGSYASPYAFSYGSVPGMCKSGCCGC